MAKQRKIIKGEKRDSFSTVSKMADATGAVRGTRRWRTEYQRAYYKVNAEKAKTYQHEYNLTHRRNKSTTDKPPKAKRQVIKTSLNSSDLLHIPIEKFEKAVSKILKKERVYVG